MKSRLILASHSIGRKKLLQYLKVPFEIVPSRLDEEAIVGSSPIETIRLRAKEKGEEVALRIQNSELSKKKKSDTHHKPKTDYRQPFDSLSLAQGKPTTIILSADSGAILDDQLIGKPKDEKDAYRILLHLCGRTHEFVTAIYIVALTSKPGVELAAKKVLLNDTDRSYVTFRKMTDEDIRLYIKLTDYTRFAGGYAVFSAQNFITKIEGSISNVIGLPLEKLIPVLVKHKVISATR